MAVKYDIPLAHALSGEPLRDVELVINARAGEDRIRLDIARALYDSSGELVEVVAADSDVDGNCRLPETQPASEQDSSLRRLQIERMPLAYLLFDASFRLLDWNPAAERIFGYSKAEVVGMEPPFEKILPAGQREHVDQVLTRIEAGDMSAHSVNENITKDGRSITCEWFNTPLIGDDGRFAGLLCLAQDITERRRLEEQLRESQKMKAIGQLAGGVAHDFNNLLTIIIGYCEMLLEPLGSDDAQRGSLEEISKAAERCAALTRQLLVFSRMQRHAPAVLDLNEVVCDTERMLRGIIGEEAQLLTTLDPRLGRIKADAVQLQQVLLNLAANARDAMPAGGRLTIETANVELDEEYARAHVAVRPGHYVRLRLTDSGTGMTEDVKSHLYEPFFTTKESGTGLGLAVVHGVVSQSDGHIEVESESDVGTSFKIYLPRCKDEAGELLR